MAVVAGSSGAGGLARRRRPAPLHLRGHVEAVRVVHPADEHREGGDRLLQHVHPKLGHVRRDRLLLGDRHRLRGHGRRQGRVHDAPGHRRCDLHRDVVRARGLDLLEVVGLDLQGHELLEAPILVVQEMRVTALQDLLLPVVLGHRRVPLVHGEQGVRAQLDVVVVQAHGLLELQGLAGPDVDPGREEEGLAVVHRDPDVALLHDQDGSVPVLQLAVVRQCRGANVLHEDGIDVVHAGLREEVPPPLVHKQPDMPRWDEHLEVRGSVEDAAHHRTAIVPVEAAPPQVVLLGGGGLPVIALKDLLERLLAVVCGEQPCVPQRPVRWGVLHVRQGLVAQRLPRVDPRTLR